MIVTPSLDKFSKIYNKKQPQIIYTRYVADLETPISILQKISINKKNYILLETVNTDLFKDRYSIIGIDPDIVWRANGNKSEINRNAFNDNKKFLIQNGNALDNLRSLLLESRINLPKDIPPIIGIYGYIGFDTFKLIENIDSNLPDIFNIPDMYMIRPTFLIIFDKIKEEIILINNVWYNKNINAKSAYLNAVNYLISSIKLLKKSKYITKKISKKIIFKNPVSNITSNEYKDIVKKAKKYIESGDIFQVVLSQCFINNFELSPLELYRVLRRINPSPFLYYLNFDNFAIVGSSPEILIRIRNKKITVRPIAGTRPLGKTLQETQKYSYDLLNDSKELAEHLMLLDLGRNDIGKISKLNSIKITDSFFLEYYSEVMHIVSNIISKLNSKYDLIDALTAVFPAGTVSGAPKIRAVEIIEELEFIKRGIYAGCLGYFGADGNMDSCIVLRTAIIKDGKMYVQAGAGIVADSNPEEEYKECVNKARALFNAAEIAVQLANAEK